MSKSCLKVVKKLSKSCQKVVEIFVRFSKRDGRWKKKKKPAATRQGKDRGFINNVDNNWNGWNGGSRPWPDWNGLEWRKKVLFRLEWLRMEEIGFAPAGMTLNEGSWFWLDWNDLDGRKSVWARLEWHGYHRL
jgi:hypothetical protein